MGVKLTLVMLFVNDLATAKAFYTETVGLEVVPEFTGGDFVYLRLADGSPVVLRDVKALPPEVAAQPGGSILGLEVEDVEATWRDWKTRGVAVLSDVMDMGAGRTFLARDPDGHALYITQLYDGVKALRRQYGIDR
jgi:predicted enzyme related to lactoylglutathione lyase